MSQLLRIQKEQKIQNCFHLHRKSLDFSLYTFFKNWEKSQMSPNSITSSRGENRSVRSSCTIFIVTALPHSKTCQHFLCTDTQNTSTTVTTGYSVKEKKKRLQFFILQHSQSFLNITATATQNEHAGLCI